MTVLLVVGGRLLSYENNNKQSSLILRSKKNRKLSLCCCCKPLTVLRCPRMVFKGIDRPFELSVEIESRLIRSVMTNWRLGWFFKYHFKGSSSQDQQKTNRRRLVNSKVTLTGQSHFADFFDSVRWIGGFLRESIKSAKWILLYSVQCTEKPHRVTLRNHTSRISNCINSVPWLYAVTSTPYHDFTWSHELRTMIDTELMRFGKVALQSTKISIKWL